MNNWARRLHGYRGRRHAADIATHHGGCPGRRGNPHRDRGDHSGHCQRELASYHSDFAFRLKRRRGATRSARVESPERKG